MGVRVPWRRYTPIVRGIAIREVGIPILIVRRMDWLPITQLRSASTSRCLQACSESIDLLFKLGHPTIGFLLPLSGGLCDYTAPTGLCTSLTRPLQVRQVGLTFHFQTATCFTSAWSLRIVWVMRRSVCSRKPAGCITIVDCNRPCCRGIGGEDSRP